jgi:soluble lytic murein transglycosylase-like protein
VTSAESWRSLVSEYFPAGQVNNALAVIQAESGGNRWAIDYDRDGSVDRGGMQINSIHAAMVSGDLTRLYDPATNVRVGAEIWQHSGWCAWTTARQLGLCK